MSPNIPPQTPLPPHHTYTNGIVPSEPNHYQVLGLDLVTVKRENEKISQAEIKKAYRDSLLKWHPDKVVAGIAEEKAENEKEAEEAERYSFHQLAKNGNGYGHARTGVSTGKGFTVDQIRKAYEVLSNDKSRREYNRLLSQRLSLRGDSDTSLARWTRPMERLDLDEFIMQGYEEGQEKYTRLCRCGEQEGYAVMSKELDKAVEMGLWEVEVECIGCSLGVVVEFGEMQGEDEEGR